MSKKNETNPLKQPDVSGSDSSEPNPVTQPQMWVDWYQIVYGGNEQDAKKAWGKKMYLLGY
jgi:hypothetical protein